MATVTASSVSEAIQFLMKRESGAVRIGRGRQRGMHLCRQAGVKFEISQMGARIFADDVSQVIECARKEGLSLNGDRETIVDDRSGVTWHIVRWKMITVQMDELVYPAPRQAVEPRDWKSMRRRHVA